jgi:hypothetical protein
MLLSLAGCGQPAAQTNKPESTDTTAKSVVFPVTGVVEHVLKGSSNQVSMVRDNRQKVQFEVKDDARVFFNSKESSINTIANGQTVYVESADGTNASMIIIKNWPGFEKPGPAVKFTTQRAFEFALDFIRTNHKQLGLPEANAWTQTDKDTKVGQDTLKRVMSWSVYRIRLIWVSAEEELNYDIILYKAGKETAIWSGSVLKDSSVREDRYENP